MSIGPLGGVWPPETPPKKRILGTRGGPARQTLMDFLASLSPPPRRRMDIGLLLRRGFSFDLCRTLLHSPPAMPPTIPDDEGPAEAAQ